MKAVFIGGGSLRLLGIIRGALARGLFQNGEVNLYDLNIKRAAAMAQMVAKTPEHRECQCLLTHGTSLARALDGADMVGVILMAGSAKSFLEGEHACYQHGFVPSDNVSPNGAFLAVKGAPILLNIAKQMQKYCPKAWLINFANPVAVVSGLINNHTPIKSLGVCAGYTNHHWDLSRIFGIDEQGIGFDVETVGINHLSFIVKGTMNGKDLFRAIDRRIAKDWKMPPLQPIWPRAYHLAIPAGIKTMIRFWRELSILIFSTEADGMMHLQYEQTLAQHLRHFKPLSKTRLNRRLANRAKLRADADQYFRSHLSRNLDNQFWLHGWREPGNDWAKRQDRDIFVEILRGLSGEKIKVVSSRPNHGAARGFTNRTVLEYSQIFEDGKLLPAGEYKVPAVVYGLIASLASHQTLLGDALAANDPRLLAHALLAYPVQPFSKNARNLYKSLARINASEMSRELRSVTDFL